MVIGRGIVMDIAITIEAGIPIRRGMGMAIGTDIGIRIRISRRTVIV